MSTTGPSKVSIPEMELFRTEEHYVLMNSESSLWTSRRTGEISIRPGWELANSGDVECLGVFHGLIGKIDLQGIGESRLLLIKEADIVGQLPDGRTVAKIRSIAFLQPTASDAPPSEIGLKPCKKHRGGARGSFYNSGNMFDIPQKAAFAKTWGTIKSATNSIKSTTQQAAALATYQVKGGTRKDIKDREKFEKRIIEELQRVFTETDSFYFGLGGSAVHGGGRDYSDLTTCLQEFHTPGSSTDDRFFWNKYMLKDVLDINSELAKAWILPIIQGYVQIEHCSVEADPSAVFLDDHKEELCLAIVSRRSRHRAGTRYKRRGLDEEGHCANYVETELSLGCHSHSLSFVQVRGSVPLYWSQPGFKYRPPPHIDRGEGETKIAFEKHMKGELDHYGGVCIVNLAEQSGKERVIWEGFGKQVLQFNNERVTYAVFDFHEHCRGMKFENVSLLISRLEEVIQEMRFCWKDEAGIICRQSGVFRVNCIDCLDRTNVVQTAIGKAVLELQLTKLGLLPPDSSLPPALRSKFQLLWANNGDIISKQYAGTNALKGDFTRTGERKFTGMMKDGMNSANRYLKRVLSDDLRQVCLELCQGVPLNLVCLDSSLTWSLDLYRRDLADLMSTQVQTYHPLTGQLYLGLASLRLARYYLSRFKDVYRQATIDIMQGHAVTEDSLEDEGDTGATAEHVKLLIEDCKKFIVSDSSIVLGAWGLINADPHTGDPTETDMDTILILTKDAYYVADYDDEVDKIVKCERVNLCEVRAVELGLVELVPPHSALHIFNKTKGSRGGQCCLRVQYRQDDTLFAHLFRSSHLRFFNNVAIVIKGDDEMIESLRAICDSFRIALESAYPELVEEVRWRIEPEATLEEAPPASRPPVSSMTELQLDSIKSVGLNFKPARVRRNLTLVASFQTTLDALEAEMEVIERDSLGSKALSNMTSRISKLGNTLNPRKKSAQGPSTALPEVKLGGEEGGGGGGETEREAYHLPGVGIVMSNALIEAVDPSDVIISEDYQLTVTKPSELKVRTFSHSSGEVSEKEQQLRGGSGGGGGTGGGGREGGRGHSMELPVIGMTGSQSENALRSLRSGLGQAAGTVLTSPSAVLSPLTRLAKGVLSTVGKEGGGPERSKAVEELREAWAAADCKSQLIAV